ncbi:alpha/beta fold hydrolase [Mycobacterium sp. 050134]|uniref:alpha/beta fold hydrolase n=1 Tax=Mycobacterium sp. 050134 TaxID=3096111 RepID=UPI002ED9498F
MAVATTGLARGVVLVSPIDDVGYPPTTALLPEEYRTMVDAVALDANAVEQRLSAYTADALFDMLMSNYPTSDEAIYGQPGFRSLLRTALEDGFASGAAGYARDTVLAMSAWPAKLFDPGVDVCVLFGADDRVHSPDLGLTLAERICGARRDIVDLAGGGLLWSHPDVVLAAAALVSGE